MMDETGLFPLIVGGIAALAFGALLARAPLLMFILALLAFPILAGLNK
jgi:hypothetical protein